MSAIPALLYFWGAAYYSGVAGGLRVPAAFFEYSAYTLISASYVAILEGSKWTIGIWVFVVAVLFALRDATAFVKGVVFHYGLVLLAIGVLLLVLGPTITSYDVGHEEGRQLAEHCLRADTLASRNPSRADGSRRRRCKKAETRSASLVYCARLGDRVVFRADSEFLIVARDDVKRLRLEPAPADTAAIRRIEANRSKK